jgi:hypothetical protein
MRHGAIFQEYWLEKRTIAASSALRLAESCDAGKPDYAMAALLLFHHRNALRNAPRVYRP